MRNLIVKHVFGVACLAVLTGCQQAPQLVDYPVLRVDVRQKVIASASLVIVGTLGRDEAVGAITHSHWDPKLPLQLRKVKCSGSAGNGKSVLPLR